MKRNETSFRHPRVTRAIRPVATQGPASAPPAVRKSTEQSTRAQRRFEEAEERRRLRKERKRRGKPTTGSASD